MWDPAAPQRHMQVPQPPFVSTRDRYEHRCRRVQPRGPQLTPPDPLLDTAVDELRDELGARPPGVFESQMGLRQLQCDDGRSMLYHHTVERCTTLADDGQHRVVMRRNLPDQHFNPTCSEDRPRPRSQRALRCCPHRLLDIV